jgi:hypothetical protein
MSDEPQSPPTGTSEREEQLDSLLADYLRDTEAGGYPDRLSLDTAPYMALFFSETGGTLASRAWYDDCLFRKRLIFNFGLLPHESPACANCGNCWRNRARQDAIHE